MISSYSIRNLQFSYSNQPILSIDSLDIPASQVIALVGPNGAGKTTLLHLFAFLITPQKGSISFFGDLFSDSDLIKYRRKVGLLPQNPYLLKFSTIENIAIGLKLRGVPRGEANRMAQEALKKVGMEGYESRWPNSLSGGEAQRIALARTLALNPDVFLFDEPGNHLDSESVRRAENMILDLNRHENKTVIFTTHNLSFAQNLTDSIIHMFEGHVVPTAPYNLFRGRIIDHGRVFDTGSIQFDISGTTGQGSTLLIDPCKISFSTTQEFDKLPNVFYGTMVSISLFRNVVRIEALAGATFEIHTEVSPETSHLHIGERIRLYVGPDAMTIV